MLFDIEKELQPFDREAALARPNPFRVLDPSNPEGIRKYRVISLHGGRGSGKTFSVADSITRYMAVSRMKVLCGRELQVSIADSSKAELELAIERQGTNSFNITNQYIQHRRTLSEAVFKGLKSNIDSLKSIAGIKLVWNEEAQTTSKETLEKLLPSIRTDGNRIIQTMNPEDEDAFVYQEFIKKAGQPGYEDRLAIQVNYYDNPYFTKSLESDRQNALQRILDAPNEDARNQAIADYAWIWLGHTKRIVGNAVLKRTELREFEAPPEHTIELMYGADWSNGGADPYAAVRCFIADNERGKPCLWIEYDAYSNTVQLDDVPAYFRKCLPGLALNMAGVPQPTMRADSALPLAISKMNDSGIWCEGAKKGEGSLEAGIVFLNNFDRIYIHPRCKDTQEEARKYRWKTDKLTGKILPTLEKGNDHIWDAVRYALEHLILEKAESFFDFMKDKSEWQWSEIGKQFVRKSDVENAAGKFSGGFGFR